MTIVKSITAWHTYTHTFTHIHSLSDTHTLTHKQSYVVRREIDDPSEVHYSLRERVAGGVVSLQTRDASLEHFKSLKRGVEGRKQEVWLVVDTYTSASHYTTYYTTLHTTPSHLVQYFPVFTAGSRLDHLALAAHGGLRMPLSLSRGRGWECTRSIGRWSVCVCGWVLGCEL
jgi:hypothetical protein